MMEPFLRLISHTRQKRALHQCVGMYHTVLHLRKALLQLEYRRYSVLESLSQPVWMIRALVLRALVVVLEAEILMALNQVLLVHCIVSLTFAALSHDLEEALSCSTTSSVSPRKVVSKFGGSKNVKPIYLR